MSLTPHERRGLRDSHQFRDLDDATFVEISEVARSLRIEGAQRVGVWTLTVVRLPAMLS